MQARSENHSYAAAPASRPSSAACTSRRRRHRRQPERHDQNGTLATRTLLRRGSVLSGVLGMPLYGEFLASVGHSGGQRLSGDSRLADPSPAAPASSLSASGTLPAPSRAAITVRRKRVERRTAGGPVAHATRRTVLLEGAGARSMISSQSEAGGVRRGHRRRHLAHLLPVLDGVKGQVQMEHDASDRRTMTARQVARVREAVRAERERVSPEQVAEPETSLGRDIKQQMGAPTALVDEIMRQGGEEALRQLKPPRKPH